MDSNAAILSVDIGQTLNDFQGSGFAKLDLQAEWYLVSAATKLLIPNS